MDNFYWLDQIQPSDRPFVGQKAFLLSQLLQRGYPVVPGFVVPARNTAPSSGASAASANVPFPLTPNKGIAFWEFIETLGESEPLLRDLPYSSFHVDVDNSYQLQQVAQQIRREIASAALPSHWATSFLTAVEALDASVLILRPSVSLQLNDSELTDHTFETHSQTPSWLAALTSKEPSFSYNSINAIDVLPPGILESYTCARDPDALILSLKRVWAELFRARSLFYWQRNGIELQQLNLAVLVQPLREAIASGTVEANPAEWRIQATWGIGEALAKGEVLPDSYQLQADTGTVISSQLGSKTRAYRLRHRSESDTLIERGLQAYVLGEEQQKQYALEEKYFKQLIKLSQQFVTELTPSFSIEWALCQPPDHSEPQLYLTQFIPQPLTASAPISMSTQPTTPSFTPQIVRGLPAAAGRVTAPAQVLSSEDKTLTTMLPGRILVAPSISPNWLPWLKLAAGVVTEQGGMTSHAAIISRELGIPAVVSVANVTQLIETGDFLFLDGDQGEVHRLNRSNANAIEESPITNPPSPITSLYPIATQLFVNVSQPRSLEKIVGLPVDGIGLLRSELMMLDALENQPLDTWLRQGKSSELVTRLAQYILQFAAAFAPRPVFYRSLDWRSHELQRVTGMTSPTEPEVNPIVGRRGTLRYLDDPTCFDLELAALGQVQGYGYANIHLMLPFVRTVEEFSFCRRRVEQAGLARNPHFQLWIMAEVPSVLFLLPDYVKAGVQGISIGTNDLTQLLLAADRDREPLNSSLNGRHPAVRRALKQLVETARNVGIPCSICGQAPVQYPELIDPLVQWGITSVSVDVNDVERTYQAIARAEQRLLLEAARQKIN
ncbi:MAG: putative PEP-binding protein [Cyanobacteriota bacterium]